MVKAKTISFIGAGKMAEALIKGLLESRLISSKNIIASDLDRKRLLYIKRNYKVKIANDNLSAVESGSIIILAVKPQKMKEVLVQIGGMAGGKLVVSIAAGIRLKTLERYMPKARIIRVMPNNPCLIGCGISAVCRGKRASKKDLDSVKEMFGSVGWVIDISEDLMDAVTALSGSGPGFIYYILEAFMESGKKLRFPEEASRELVLQTFIGSIKTAAFTGKQPAALREMVTSPGGTTLEGMKVLMKGKVKEKIVHAILAAKRRAGELSKEFS